MVGQTLNAISRASAYGTPRLIMLQSTSCGYVLTQKRTAMAINSRKLTRVPSGAIEVKGVCLKGCKNCGHIRRYVGGGGGGVMG